MSRRRSVSEADVLGFLVEHPASSTVQTAIGLDRSERPVRDVLLALHAAGRIVRELRTTGQATSWRYSVPT